jgi:hypothetical protein
LINASWNNAWNLIIERDTVILLETEIYRPENLASSHKSFSNLLSGHGAWALNFLPFLNQASPTTCS